MVANQVEQNLELAARQDNATPPLVNRQGSRAWNASRAAS